MFNTPSAKPIVRQCMRFSFLSIARIDTRDSAPTGNVRSEAIAFWGGRCSA